VLVRIGRMILGVVLASCVASVAPAQTAAAAETAAQRDARAWWRDAQFGMFIHWGAYAVPAGVYHGERVPEIGEWIMSRSKIPGLAP
jgi:alpha-L-fucosidase